MNIKMTGRVARFRCPGDLELDAFGTKLYVVWECEEITGAWCGELDVLGILTRNQRWDLEEEIQHSIVSEGLGL